MAQTPVQKTKFFLEHLLEVVIFNARWLMAPFYLGLIISLAMLMVVFGYELAHGLLPALTSPEDAIMLALSLIDLSLAGNLLLIVIFSGYENFVSKIDTAGHEDRPQWMGTVDFSGMKLKLIGSIVAISAISLLRSFMTLAQTSRDAAAAGGQQAGDRLHPAAVDADPARRLRAARAFCSRPPTGSPARPSPTRRRARDGWRRAYNVLIYRHGRALSRPSMNTGSARRYGSPGQARR